MEPNLNYLQPHRHVSIQPPFLINANGILRDRPKHHLFSSASASPLKKKRARPRKYTTPEQAFAVRKAAASSPSAKERKESPATLLQQLTKQGVVGNSDSGDGKRGYLSKKSMTQSSFSGGFGHNAVKF